MHSKNVQRYKGKSAAAKKSKPTYTYPNFKTEHNENSMLDIACDYKYRPSIPTSGPPPEQLQPVLLSKTPLSHIEQNNFQIMDTKNINASLTLAYCGVQTRK